jgi:hypothetical protein
MVGSFSVHITGFQDGSDPRIESLEKFLRRLTPRLVKVFIDTDV